MSILYQWAITHGIPHAALQDLQCRLGLLALPELAPPPVAPGKTEAYSQSVIRLEASRKGIRLWRNNVGALIPEGATRPVRYGLANDSAAVNAILKSADLIGIRPVRIEPAHVGLVLGQFVSREAKAPGWHYTGTEREEAQAAWMHLVNSMGGDAAIATGEGTL